MLNRMNVHPLAERFDSKLLLRHEIPLPNHTLQRLISEKVIHTEQSIIRFRGRIKCMRCGNENKKTFAHIPCARCCKTHHYCRQCIEMGRVLTCEPLYYVKDLERNVQRIPSACQWQGKLTDAQQKAADRIIEAIDKKEKELLIWAVAGSGKTEVLFPSIEYALAKGYRTCVATPRADVVRELLPRLEEAFPRVLIDGLYGGASKSESGAQLVVATTHQLIRFKHSFQLMIIDEIDAFPYTDDPMLPFVTKRARKQSGTTVYLTATPRKDLQKRVRRKQLPHIFIPVRYHNHPLPVPQLISDYSLKKQLNKNDVPTVIFKFLHNRDVSSRQLLIFVPTIKMAEHLRPLLIKECIRRKLIKNADEIASVHAEDELREQKVERFRRKEIQLLITTTILERGVTFPSVDVIVLCADHVVFDEAALVQIAGRAGRSVNDPKGHVLFVHSGRTHALDEAVQSIKQMNRRGGFLL